MRHIQYASKALQKKQEVLLERKRKRELRNEKNLELIASYDQLAIKLKNNWEKKYQNRKAEQ